MKTLSLITLLVLITIAHCQNGVYRCNRNGSNNGNYNAAGYYNNGGYYGNSGYASDCDPEEISEDMKQVIIGVIVALIVIGIGLGGIFIWRLIVRKNTSNKVRDLMWNKRRNFATQNGLNLYEMNNSHQTFHL